MLANLFSRCVNGEPIPEIWKMAWITPIQKKKGEKTCVAITDVYRLQAPLVDSTERYLIT